MSEGLIYTRNCARAGHLIIQVRILGVNLNTLLTVAPNILDQPPNLCQYYPLNISWIFVHLSTHSPCHDVGKSLDKPSYCRKRSIRYFSEEGPALHGGVRGKKGRGKGSCNLVRCTVLPHWLLLYNDTSKNNSAGMGLLHERERERERRGVYLLPCLLAPFAISECLLLRELTAPQFLGCIIWPRGGL